MALVPRLLSPLVLVALGVLLSITIVAGEESLARGFGDHIAWTSLEAGLAEAKEKDKPLMVLIHKTWCSACKALKPAFAEEDGEIGRLSKHFVMVNLQDDEEPEEGSYAPDGKYIPRVIFVSSAGEVDKDIQNVEGNPNYLYYYSQAKEVAASMREALRKMPPKGFAEHGEL